MTMVTFCHAHLIYQESEDDRSTSSLKVEEQDAEPKQNSKESTPKSGYTRNRRASGPSTNGIRSALSNRATDGNSPAGVHARSRSDADSSEWATLEIGPRDSAYLNAYNADFIMKKANGYADVAGSIASLSGISNFGKESPMSVAKRRATGISFIGDSASTANSITPDMTPEERKELLRRNVTRMFSCIYAVFLTILGGIFYISDLQKNTAHQTEVFASFVAFLGILWLLFLHFDLHRYKRYVVSQLKAHEETLQEIGDRLSTTTEVIFNTMPTTTTGSSPPYRFLQGRHSGSFYLKAGMAAFCFGHLIHEGLRLGQHVLYLTDTNVDLTQCTDYYTITVHVIRLIYSFYQLFMIFKYSNIVINRFKELARFGLMHCIGTSVCFWFGAIIEDAMEDFEEKHGKHITLNTDPDFNETFNGSSFLCANNSLLSKQSLHAIPYLYPFTIEYNLLLAGVWFIMWQNIGNERSPHANPHHFQHKISPSDDGMEEITYQSNLVISADCHAANRGLFAGLSILLCAIVTVIVFFVTMSKENYVDVGVVIYDVQEGTLNILALVSLIVAYRQISKLDFNLHPITFLDDVLLFIPLPFFFVNTILSIMAEGHHGNTFRVAVNVIVTLQVVVQTPFIIDGLRRCSNTHSLRFKKPGREIVTFSIILNLTMWIVSTFEHKSVEEQHAEKAFYGSVVWMYIGHTTLPLMLFYRFHSSVCLADIWKSAYEKGE